MGSQKEAKGETKCWHFTSARNQDQVLGVICIEDKGY